MRETRVDERVSDSKSTIAKLVEEELTDSWVVLEGRERVAGDGERVRSRLASRITFEK